MKADVIVAGAGIVGVSVAVHLAARGRSVVLVDRRGPGEETSFGNAGLIERSSIVPMAFPRSLAAMMRIALTARCSRFHRRNSPPRMRTKSTIMRASKRAWRQAAQPGSM